jgi:hypothetical protein
MSDTEPGSDRSIGEGATRRQDQQVDAESHGENTHTGGHDGHGLDGTEEAVNGLELDNDARISDAELDDDHGGLFGSGSEDEADDGYETGNGESFALTVSIRSFQEVITNHLDRHPPKEDDDQLSETHSPQGRQGSDDAEDDEGSEAGKAITTMEMIVGRHAIPKGSDGEVASPENPLQCHLHRTGALTTIAPRTAIYPQVPTIPWR